MAGYMALTGSAVLVRWDDEDIKACLSEELVEDLLNWDRIMVQRQDALRSESLFEAGASAWYPVGIGGVFNALWYMADHWGTGFDVQLKRLPVRQETIEVCEIREKNPYYMWSDGCWLLAADHGDRVCEVLKAKGIPAAVIGVLRDDRDKILRHDDTVSCLNRPRADELDEYLKENDTLFAF